MNDLLETWCISARVSLYLLDALSDEQLAAVPGEKKGRSVGAQLAHIHNVRLMWLKSGAPELMDGLEKFESGVVPEKAVLRAALEGSGNAVESMLSGALESGKLRGFKPHPIAFLGYLIAHEAHHRGQVAQALRIAGVPLDKTTSFGIWEWGVR